MTRRRELFIQARPPGPGLERVQSLTSQAAGAVAKTSRVDQLARMPFLRTAPAIAPDRQFCEPKYQPEVLLAPITTDLEDRYLVAPPSPPPSSFCPYVDSPRGRGSGGGLTFWSVSSICPASHDGVSVKS